MTNNNRVKRRVSGHLVKVQIDNKITDANQTEKQQTSHIYIHIYIHIYTYIYAYKHMYINAFIYTHMIIYTSICIYIYAYVCII